MRRLLGNCQACQPNRFHALSLVINLATVCTRNVDENRRDFGLFVSLEVLVVIVVVIMCENM